jgi:hypothetical protein
MRHHHYLRTSVALVAATALLGACSESGADDDTKADQAPSSSTSTPTPTPTATSAPTEAVDLPDGVQALPGPDAGTGVADLDAGRYRIPLGEDLAFDIDLAAKTSVHDGGLFLSTGHIVIKTEIAGEDYGVPRDPCTSQAIDPVGPTVEDLVAALADLTPYEVSRPTKVMLGGAKGRYVEARIPRSYDASPCADKTVLLPGNPDTAVGASPPYVGRWWVLDVGGQRVVVQQNCWGCTPDELRRAPSAPESMSFTSLG